MYRYFWIMLLCLGFWTPVVRAESFLTPILQQAPAEMVFILAQGQAEPQMVFSGGQTAETPLPLHRLSDLLVSQAVLNHLQQHRLSVETPVNYHLGGDLRLLPPAGASELTLADLLARRAGFPLRQSSLFVSKAQNTQSVRAFLAEELMPLPLASGQTISSHSLGDLVLAQVLEQLSQQTLQTVLPEFARSQGLALMQAELKPPLPLTPELYAYSLSAKDMGHWLKLMQQASWQEHLLHRHDAREQHLPGASRGLLSQPLSDGESLFYLDSEWLGYIQRMAFVPSQNLAFYVGYRGHQPEFKQQLTAQLLQQQSVQTSACSLPATAAGYYRPLNLEQRSVLAALKPFRQLQLSAQGQWRPARWGASWQNPQTETTGCQIWLHTADTLLLREPVAGFSHFVRSRWFEIPWVQLGLFALFLLVFFSMMGRGLRDLYLYEPQLPDLNSDASDASDPAASDEEMKLRAGWDLPLLASLGSSTALSSGLLIFPALLSIQRLGPHLSVAIRDQPSGWLVVALVLPLISLILALILFALLLTEWRSRPWNMSGGRYERLHYCLYLSALLGWLVWLGQFRLLGFAL